MKDIKSEWCHNLGPGRILGGSVAATAHVEVRFSFTCNSIFCLHRKNFAHGKIKSRKKSLVKKKKQKKIGPRKKERVPFCKEKKNFLCKRDL